MPRLNPALFAGTLSALDESGGLTAVLGPTNTGKTYFALERMLSHPTGMIGLPLRLLAREVYDKLTARVGERAVALVTGEEKRIPPSARYWVSTVEAMPLERQTDFMAIDEVQLAADTERGQVFTHRILNARGRKETIFLGSETMRPVLKRLFPEIDFIARERFSTLAYAGVKKVTRLPRRTAIVGFSADMVYAIAELVRRQRGGAAVVLGALSPRTRNAQAELYQSGEVDYLIATDAIGMGLNMDIDHVAFAAARKFDGRHVRDLRVEEAAQIAGRAGRHVKDGTFGATADCRGFSDEMVEAIETHVFPMIDALQWRPSRLDFSSVEALSRALAGMPPADMPLKRAPPAEDELSLARLMARPEVRERAQGIARVTLLWDVCQIPDFRKLAFDQHARLLTDVYEQICDDGRISEAWLGPQVERIDRTDGDIDAISTRIAHVRSWTYLANRSGWIENESYWRQKTRALEDRLSDALHEKLTQRFVDRRTALLMRKLRDDAPLLAGVSDDGEVTVEGQFVGRLTGFEFVIDPRATGPEAKRLRYAAEKALRPTLAARAAALATAQTQDLSLEPDGTLIWRSSIVGVLEKGPAPLRPTLRVRGLDAIHPSLRTRVVDRLTDFVAHRVEALLADLIGLKQAADRIAPKAAETPPLNSAPATAPHTATPSDTQPAENSSADEPQVEQSAEKAAETGPETGAEQGAETGAGATPTQNAAPPRPDISANEASTGLAGVSRGVAFQLFENFGAMSRAPISVELKQIGQDERAKLRKLGIRFGEYTLFMPALLKPAPASLLTMLWAIWTDRQPAEFRPPKAGLVSLPLNKDLPHAYYYASGYRPSGERAVRIDMLERLAGQIRSARNDADFKGAFEASAQMMSLVGCSGDEFESILTSLGYRKQTITVKRPAPADAQRPEKTATDAPGDDHAAAGSAANNQGADDITPAGGDTAPPDGPEANTPDAATPEAETPEAATPETDGAPDATDTRVDVEVTVWRMAPHHQGNRGRGPRRDGRQHHGGAASEGDDQRRGDRRGPRKNRGQANQASGKRADAHTARDGDGRSNIGDHRGPRHDQSKGPRQGANRNRGPQNMGKGKGNNAPRTYNAGPRRKGPDPDSPFAILASLKDGKDTDKT